MSTKTTFKRVALVAVAALGLGVLSVGPSQATVSSVSVTTSGGTATQIGADSSSATVNADSTTAGNISVSALLDTALETVTVGIQTKSAPTGATGAIRLVWVDTTTPLASTTKIGASVTTNTGVTKYDSITAGSSVFSISHTSTGYVGARFKLQLDSATAGYPAGTYVTTVVVKAYSVGAYSTPATTTYDVTTTVSKATAQSTTPSAAYSTAWLGSSTTVATTTDAAVSGVATADGTQIGNIDVVIKNASQTTGVALDSLTATLTGPGLISADGSTWGKSFVYNVTAGAVNVKIRADGNAGVATIALSTTTTTFTPKTVTFYAKSPKTITASVNNPVLNVGTNGSAVVATAVDANGNAWTGQLYIKALAAADALIGGSATDPIGCTWTASLGVHVCPITTIAAGTASFVVVDETLDTDAVYAAADSAATSNTVSVTVSSGTPTTVKLAFDKSSYAPYEKAIITVTPLDAAGKTMGTKQVTNLFASGGISANQAFSGGSDTLTAVTLTTSADSSATAPRTAGAYTYVVYMPAQGDVTISATGGAGLAAAGQVKVTATASVVNSAVDAATDAANEATDAANAATDAALAAADAADAATAAAQDASDAVAALSASVSKMIASLKAQITSLTNLVIKIQKKVRA